MKKEIISLIIGLFSLPAMAQIEMFDESIKKVETISKAEPYDSLRNMHTQRYGTKDRTFFHL